MNYLFVYFMLCFAICTNAGKATKDVKGADIRLVFPFKHKASSCGWDSSEPKKPKPIRIMT